jgi:hypothetical protein
MNLKRSRDRVGIALAVSFLLAAATAIELRRRFVVTFQEETSKCVVCRSDRYREVRWGIERRNDVLPSTFSHWVEQNYGVHTHSWVPVSSYKRFFLRSWGICGDAHYLPISFIPEEAHRRLLLTGKQDQLKAFHQAVLSWDTFPEAAAMAGLEWRNLRVPHGVEECLDRAERKQEGIAIGMGTPLTERPSRTTNRTDRVMRGSSAY